MVPWLLMIPGIVIAGWVSNRLIIKGFNVGQTRKICEGLCGFTEACCLISIGKFLSPPKNMYVQFCTYYISLPKSCFENAKRQQIKFQDCMEIHLSSWL